MDEGYLKRDFVKLIKGLKRNMMFSPSLRDIYLNKIEKNIYTIRVDLLFVRRFLEYYSQDTNKVVLLRRGKI